MYHAADTHPYGITSRYATPATELQCRDYLRNVQIMSCLWSEQGVTQQTLAERTAKDKACLTSLMTNLERKGLVCRHENPKDRRNKLVYLTEKGEEFHQRIAPQLKEYYDRLERILGKEQIKLTDKLLKDLQHAIETY